ncbi:MAG: dihydrofolate reductase [Verrucomicrobia bacterium]|nr:dihydrofolate reductase [Verrucomicrobiota bacterium]
MPVKAFKAIAAMSENRVIGAAGRIPWHLPEDFRWFKQTTLGHILVMGRKTFESIGRPLPGRQTLILSRQGFSAPGTATVTDLAALEAWVANDPREVFVAGGAEIYSLLLPRCSDLFLTRVKRTVSGDALFPSFEADFVLLGKVLENDDFTVEHYQHRNRLLV